MQCPTKYWKIFRRGKHNVGRVYVHAEMIDTGPRLIRWFIFSHVVLDVKSQFERTGQIRIRSRSRFSLFSSQQRPHVEGTSLKGDAICRFSTAGECGTLHAVQGNRNVSSILQRVSSGEHCVCRNAYRASHAF